MSMITPRWSLRVYLLVLLIVLLAGPSSSFVAAQTEEAPRALFLGNSAYAAQGGSQSPFEAYCSAVGIRCEALNNYDMFGRSPGGRVDWQWSGLAEDQRVADLLEREPFDYVVLWTRYTVVLDESQWPGAIEGLHTVVERVARSGATTVLVLPYIWTDQLGAVDRVEEGFERFLEEVLRMQVDGESPPVIFVPLGRFWADGAEHFGTDVWYSDPRHGSPLAQYATGCLWFTFLLGQDPRGISFSELPTHPELDEAERNAEADAQAVDWIQRRVWQLFTNSR